MFVLYFSSHISSNTAVWPSCCVVIRSWKSPNGPWTASWWMRMRMRMMLRESAGVGSLWEVRSPVSDLRSCLYCLSFIWMLISLCLCLGISWSVKETASSIRSGSEQSFPKIDTTPSLSKQGSGYSLSSLFKGNLQWRVRECFSSIIVDSPIWFCLCSLSKEQTWCFPVLLWV